MIVRGFAAHNRSFATGKKTSGTQGSSLYEKKNFAVYYFQKSLFVPQMFKFLKYANEPSGDVIHSAKFWSNMMKKDISAKFIRNIWLFD